MRNDPLDDLRRISRILGSRRNGTISPMFRKLNYTRCNKVESSLAGQRVRLARLHVPSRPSTWGCTDIRLENAALNVIYGFVGALRRPCTPPHSRLIS